MFIQLTSTSCKAAEVVNLLLIFVSILKEDGDVKYVDTDININSVG